MLSGQAHHLQQLHFLLVGEAFDFGCFDISLKAELLPAEQGKSGIKGLLHVFHLLLQSLLLVLQLTILHWALA